MKSTTKHLLDRALFTIATMTMATADAKTRATKARIAYNNNDNNKCLLWGEIENVSSCIRSDKTEEKRQSKGNFPSQ